MPTIGWEAVREGVDDYRYLTTLSKLIARAKAAGRIDDVKRAERLLKQLTDKINVSGYQAGMQGGLATKRRMGNHYDRTPPQGKIVQREYDQFRRKLADEILHLSRVLSR